MQLLKQLQTLTKNHAEAADRQSEMLEKEEIRVEGSSEEPVKIRIGNPVKVLHQPVESVVFRRKGNIVV